MRVKIENVPIDNNATLGTSVVGSGNGVKLFLPGRIPQHNSKFDTGNCDTLQNEFSNQSENDFDQPIVKGGT